MYRIQLMCCWCVNVWIIQGFHGWWVIHKVVYQFGFWHPYLLSVIKIVISFSHTYRTIIKVAWTLKLTVQLVECAWFKIPFNFYGIVFAWCKTHKQFNMIWSFPKKIHGMSQKIYHQILLGHPIFSQKNLFFLISHLFLWQLVFNTWISPMQFFKLVIRVRKYFDLAQR
jgi:hypothetical protein